MFYFYATCSVWGPQGYINRICAGQSVANSLGSDSSFPLSHFHSTFHLEDVACHRINTGNLIAKAKDKDCKDIEIDDLYTETVVV